MIHAWRAQSVALLAIAASVTAGCSKTDVATPVATVSLATNKTSVPLGSPIELTYKFEVAPGARIDKDYRVFVHVNRDDGTTIWNDDHDLPADQTTSKWKPGQVIQYSRTRFIPAFSYVGKATIDVGLYRDNERLPLASPEPSDSEAKTRSYKVGELDLLPRTASIRLIRLAGWHQPEYAKDDAGVEWQWTQKVATLSLKNDRRDLTLYLEFDARPDQFPDKPQQVTVYSGETALATFPADQSGIVLKRIPLTAAQLGTGEMAELRIDIDRTFTPSKLPGGSGDSRELGIRVYHAFVEAR